MVSASDVGVGDDVELLSPALKQHVPAWKREDAIAPLREAGVYDALSQWVCFRDSAGVMRYYHKETHQLMQAAPVEGVSGDVSEVGRFGTLLFKAGHLEEASVIYAAVISRSDSASAKGNLAMVLMMKGNNERADSLLVEALQTLGSSQLSMTFYAAMRDACRGLRAMRVGQEGGAGGSSITLDKLKASVEFCSNHEWLGKQHPFTRWMVSELADVAAMPAGDLPAQEAQLQQFGTPLARPMMVGGAGRSGDFGSVVLALWRLAALSALLAVLVAAAAVVLPGYLDGLH